MHGCLASSKSFNSRRSGSAARICGWALGVLIVIGTMGLARPAHAKEVTTNLRNGDFVAWGPNGLPQDWQRGVGSTRGEGAASRIDRRKGGGVTLSGNAGTATWYMLTQRVAVKRKAVYRLHVTAGTERLKFGAGQRPNCYVGLFFYDASGRRLRMDVRTIRSPEVRSESLVAAAPSNASSADLVLFLSMSGALVVRGVRLEVLRPDQSLHLLEDEIARHYSFLDAHKIDWKGLVSKARPQFQAAKDAESFAKTAAALLRNFRDLHVSVTTPGGP